ncbi:NHL repeat-containing protein [Parabacteroides chinchillae]|uniref:Prophage endopeptidase tail n=1 Tax=Parabacteroides chinchillae TaxID=871327 RepID=A0A8G2BWC4_9BACT|nr:hypothetical protein [Parabacteroides chinchillae]SEF85908.1 hypothetical protein SAMN05444001_10897 [Parabacteroides chinchillae]
MIIYDKNNVKILDIPVDDTSYRYRAIRQGDKVFLYFSLTEHVEIPVYSYIEFQGQHYTLWSPTNLTKHGERNLEYTVEFGGWWELLNRTKYKFLSGKPHKLKFPLTATPRMFMQLLIDNLNLHDSGWTLGTCIEATEKALAFSHESCMEVLNRLADEFNSEFEFVGKKINFGKVEYYKGDPLPLSYGKGNGFKTGVARQNQGDKAPVTILYVQGGDRNIDSTKYGSGSLLLPKSQELEYQGRLYKTDADGMYITRADRELTVYNEDGYDATNIYPSRVGTISEVITVDKDKNFYDIKDNTIPDALDYSKCRIAGEKVTIIFQSGIMAGKEFDIEQTDKELTGYIHAERRFKIVPQEIDGTIMPDETFKPSVGDTYAIFNISLPDAYVCDNVTKTGASWDMFREAVQYMFENEEENFTFTGELDSMWSKKKWLEIGGKLQPGGYVLFSDKQFQPNGLLIRITGIKDYINKPHSPELELSNTPVAGFVSSELGKIDGNEVKDEGRHNDALSFTKRRWRDAVEGLSMLENAISGFSASINPITIQTMAMLIGDESLQFRFVNNKTSPTEIYPNFVYNQQTKVFTVPATILQHMTLGISKMSSSHTASEYKYWNMSAYTSPVLDDTTAMYLYSKCSKSGTTGTFLLSKTPYKMDPGDGYYYFLTGALSSEYEAERSFVTVYGFTEILPGRITVGMIVSPDGQTYFNVAQGEFGGKFVFKSASGYNNITDRPNLQPLYDGVNDALTDAENASNAANNAAGMANSKSTVYYYQPSGGMKVNDLWVDGTNIWRWSGSSWVKASAYDNTLTSINGGLITTGAIAFGSTGGMASSGTVRIWSGGRAGANGKPPATPTFRVYDTGNIESRGSMWIANNNGNKLAGFSGDGTSATSIRIWAGNETPANAPFRVTQDGSVYMNKGVIGGLTISDTSLESVMTYNRGKMIIDSAGGIYFNESNSRFARMGPYPLSMSSGIQTLLALCDSETDGGASKKTLATFRIGRSVNALLPQTWIDCDHQEGWGSKFKVESRYLGNADAQERTCINVGALMDFNQIKKISGQEPELYPMYWDNKSQYVCYKY